MISEELKDIITQIKKEGNMHFLRVQPQSAFQLLREKTALFFPRNTKNGWNSLMVANCSYPLEFNYTALHTNL